MTTAWREEEEEDQPAPILSWLIKFSSLFSPPVLARRKHLLTHQLTDSPDWAQAGGGQGPPVLSVLRTADSQGEKSIINNIFISAYCPPSSVLRRCWHGRGEADGRRGTNRLSGTSPFSHPRRLLMVMISSWELWQSVPVVPGQMVMLWPLPPPAIPDGHQRASRKFYGFLVENI